MLRKLVAKELLDTFTSPRFVIVFVVCVALILLSVYTGLRNYESNLKYYNAATSVMHDTVSNQVSWNALAYWGQYKVYKKPSSLSILVTGLENDLGRNTTITIYGDPQLFDSKYNEHPVFAIFGSLDLEFIVKVVLSLFAILLTFDAICGEREGGTLKLVLSNSVPRDRVILGKLLGGFLALVVPLVLAMLLGLLLIVLYPRVSLSSGDWLRIVILLGVFVLYVITFMTLGLFVSSRCRRASTSFLVLLVLWVLFVLVIPKSSVMLAGYAVNVPTSAEIQEKKQAIGRQWYVEWEGWRQKWLAEHPGQTLIPDDVSDEFNKKQEEHLGTESRRIDQDYVRAQANQETWTRRVARLSPSASLTYASIDLANSGMQRQKSFLTACGEYQDAFAAYTRGKIRDEQRALARGQHPQTGPNGKLDLSDMPQMRYSEDPLGTIIHRAAFDVVLLGVLACVFFVGAYVSFLRYDVR
jgi:ABC-type transport system involved in multi-copper enzyme maturation permease subunit